jgi:hypothetical protein
VSKRVLIKDIDRAEALTVFPLLHGRATISIAAVQMSIRAACHPSRGTISPRLAHIDSIKVKTRDFRRWRVRSIQKKRSVVWCAGEGRLRRSGRL